MLGLEGKNMALIDLQLVGTGFSFIFSHFCAKITGLAFLFSIYIRDYMRHWQMWFSL